MGVVYPLNWLQRARVCVPLEQSEDVTMPGSLGRSALISETVKL